MTRSTSLSLILSDPTLRQRLIQRLSAVEPNANRLVAEYEQRRMSYLQQEQLLPQVGNAVRNGRVYVQYVDSNGRARLLDISEMYLTSTDETDAIAETILEKNAW